MQLVFEFGSPQVGPVIDAIRRAIGTLSYTVECLPKGSDTNEPTEHSLESAATKLELGEISALTIRPREGMIRYGLVFTPLFEGQPLSLYLGSIEYTGENFKLIWDLLLGTPGLTLACLGYDEGVELQDGQLTVETFPWEEWPLVVGALRTQPGLGSWTIREGPEMRWLTPRTSGTGHLHDASS